MALTAFGLCTLSGGSKSSKQQVPTGRSSSTQHIKRGDGGDSSSNNSNNGNNRGRSCSTAVAGGEKTRHQWWHDIISRWTHVVVRVKATAAAIPIGRGYNALRADNRQACMVYSSTVSCVRLFVCLMDARHETFHGRPSWM